MIERTSSTFEPFAEYVGLLVRLHQLIAEGKGESDEADDLRDRMDYPWYQLSAEELDLVGGLSEDLYTIGAVRPVPLGEPDEHLWKQFTDAVERRDWRAALNALRACESQLPAARVAYIRAACWVYLGQFDAAVEFMRERERLQPLEPAEKVLMLFLLMGARRLGEAASRADDVSESESYAPLLFAAGTALSMRATELEGEAAKGLRMRAIKLLERGLDFAANDALIEISTHERVGACLHVAANYEALGDTSRAISACADALQMEPNNLDALILHGWLIHDREPETGQKEFRTGFLSRLTSEAVTSISAVSLVAQQ